MGRNRFLLAIKDVEEIHRIERVKKEELEALEKKTEGGEVGGGSRRHADGRKE